MASTLTILELEGMYPDTLEEDAIFSAPPAHPFTVKFIQGHLATPYELLPISTLSDELCASVDGLLVFRHYCTKEDLKRFTKLKVLVRSGVGYDRLDREALAARGVTVCNVPDYGTAEIADHALALALALRRGIVLHHELQRHKPVEPWVFSPSPLVERIQGATFGILGLGRIGTAAALRARAFGWHIIFYDPFVPNGTDKALGIERVKTIEALFTRATTLSIHCPLTSHTKGLISESLLSLLPPGAIIINTARGDVIDLDALEAALKSGKVAGAALDVVPVEPPPEEGAHGLLEAYRRKEEWLEGRLIVTPHVAYYSPDSFKDIRTNSAVTMREVLLEGKNSNVILPEME